MKIVKSCLDECHVTAKCFIWIWSLRSALEVLCNSLFGSQVKKFGDPCFEVKTILEIRSV